MRLLKITLTALAILAVSTFLVSQRFVHQSIPGDLQSYYDSCNCKDTVATDSTLTGPITTTPGITILPEDSCVPEIKIRVEPLVITKVNGYNMDIHGVAPDDLTNGVYLRKLRMRMNLEEIIARNLRHRDSLRWEEENSIVSYLSYTDSLPWNYHRDSIFKVQYYSIVGADGTLVNNYCPIEGCILVHTYLRSPRLDCIEIKESSWSQVNQWGYQVVLNGFTFFKQYNKDGLRSSGFVVQ